MTSLFTTVDPQEAGFVRDCVTCGRLYTVEQSTQLYCSPICRPHARHNAARSEAREARQQAPTRFVGIDGEGIQGKCIHPGCTCVTFDPTRKDRVCACGHDYYMHEHAYVLLGCGERQLVDPDGLHYRDIFRFLYDQFLADPYAAYVGFYVGGYDWTQWLRTIPETKAWLLLTEGGRERRTMRKGERQWRAPVRLDEDRIEMGEAWEVDTLPGRRLSIRPLECRCTFTKGVKCRHSRPAWMHICDAGAYFQTSFLKLINPTEWPERPVCTQDEYDSVVAGKEHRAIAGLDNDMRRYNALENEILARVMAREDEGLRSLGIRLRRSEWYGPGSAAAAWLATTDAPRRVALQESLPPGVDSAATNAYFGGWFEVFMHGHIPGSAWEYDINSAYPHILSGLPCLLHGTWEHYEAEAWPHVNGDRRALCLVRAEVEGSDPYIGSMLHRTREDRILRPWLTAGWYWQHELDAAVRAGLIDRVDVREAWIYLPCDCPPPLKDVAGLYDYRIQVGKKTSAGKAAKLVMNSLYGKLAQGRGGRPFTNYIYASLVTAGCRTMILDAIASHPGGSASTIMVATDAVFFTEPHPSLPLSGRLGDWECTERSNLCVFKPGMYWDDQARAAIAEQKAPIFKARGVNAKAFAEHIAVLDDIFANISETSVVPETWPEAQYLSDFAMMTTRMAIIQHKWPQAGRVAEQVFKQSSDPKSKRSNPYVDNSILRTRPYRMAERVESAMFRTVELKSIMGAAFGRLAEEAEPTPLQSPDGLIEDIVYGMLGTGQWA